MSASEQGSSFSFFTEDHRMIGDAVSKVFEDLAAEDAKRRQGDESRLGRGAVEAALQELGLFALDAEDSVMTSALVQVSVARASGSACLRYPILEALLVSTIDRSGGCLPANIAISTAGSAPGRPVLSNNCISGAVWRVSFAEFATHALIVVKQDGREVLARFRLDASGVKRVPRESVEADYPLHDLYLERVVAEEVISYEQHIPMIATLSPRANLLAAAEIAGACRRMVAMTRDYLLARTQFGQVLGGNQALKHALADAHVRVEAAVIAIDYAAAALDARADDAEVAIAAAKLFAGNIGRVVAETMLQLHGAIGYTMEYSLHLLMRRVLRLANSFAAGEALEERLFEDFRSGVAQAPVPCVTTPSTEQGTVS